MFKVKKKSPKCKASYPWLNTADTKFGTPGHYKVNLVINPAQDEESAKYLEDYEKMLVTAKADCIEKIKEKISTIPANAKNKAKIDSFKNLISNIDTEFKHPLKEEYDDMGELTGNMILECRTKAQITTREGEVSDMKPKCYDATGAYLDQPPAIYAGSVLRLVNTFDNYFMDSNATCGVAKAKINGVQIISLSAGSGGSDFGVEDGGYVQEQKVTPTLDDLESDEY